MTASDILSLARAAGVGPGVAVLDVCCGVGGPGRHLVRELGCRYLGVDTSPSAIVLARERSVGLSCRFDVATVPPLPSGKYDVVLVLETLLAFADKRTLLRHIADALPHGGRFAGTVEEGMPLRTAERAAMPQADTVWPVVMTELESMLEDVNLVVTWRRDDSRSQLVVVEALVAAFDSHRDEIAAELGQQRIDELLTAHRIWSSWLRSGRIRKIAFVAGRA